MHVVALAGGVGGARYLRGLRAHLDSVPGAHQITVIGNTGDDITMWGLRVCPDLDTLTYTLGGGIDDSQGWGRVDESHRVQGELAAYGVEPQWFGLGDLDVGTHVARSLWLGQGLTLSEVTARIATRWGLPDRGIRLLPMSDQPVETHVVVATDDGEQAVHFQDWWVRQRAAVPALRFAAVGLDRAAPAPGVLDAIRTADVVVLPPSNPVVSIGIILGVPGVRDALRGTTAPVVGVAPLVAGAPVRGHADACLAAIGVPCTSEAVAGLYADFLDGWLVDVRDGTAGPEGVVVRAWDRPLEMTDVVTTAAMGAATLALADDLRH